MLRRLIGYLLVIAYPALLIGGTLWENHVCGWPRGLYDDAVCKAPEKARPHGLRGVKLLERKQWDLAIHEFEKADRAAKANPADVMGQTVGAVSLANIAFIKITQKQWEAADQLLERAREEYPPDHLVLNNSVELFLDTGQPERAFGLCIAALERFPDSAPLAWTMGDVFGELGDCEAQLRWMRWSVKLDPLDKPSARPCIQKEPSP